MATWSIALVSDIHIGDGQAQDSPSWTTNQGLLKTRLAAINPTYLAVAGDVGDDGLALEYDVWHANMSSYKAKTLAVPGNHDHRPGATAGVTPLVNWWNYFGTGTVGQGASATAAWYSVNINGWHIVCINAAKYTGGTNYGQPNYVSGSTQYNWLASDLAANDLANSGAGRPLVAIFHVPRFSEDGTHGDDSMVSDLWDLLQAHQCDVILNGHVHRYHQFNPSDSTGAGDVTGPVQITGSGVSWRTAEQVSVATAGYSEYTRSIPVVTFTDTASWEVNFHQVTVANTVLHTYSRNVLRTVTPTKPDPPVSLLVTGVGDGSVSLDWNASARADTYKVYQGTGTGTPLTADIAATQATITGLTNGTLYTFTVRAKNAGGESLASDYVTATPTVSPPPPPPPPPPPLDPPTGVVVTSVGDATASLSWNASTNATFYNVYSGTGTSTLLKTVAVTNATLTNLVNDVTYTLTVRAGNGTQESGASDFVTATPTVSPPPPPPPSGLDLYQKYSDGTFKPLRGGISNPTKPSAPTGLVVTSVGSGTVSLDWNGSTNATTYKVYQGTGTGTPLTADITATQATITGLTNGTLYTFTVRAKNTTGESGASDYVTATPNVSPPPPPPPPLQPPTGFVVLGVASGTVYLDWNASATATSYQVYQGTGTGTMHADVTTTEATITGLTNGTTYTFTVRARNATQESGASATVTATPNVSNLPLVPAISGDTFNYTFGSRIFPSYGGVYGQMVATDRGRQWLTDYKPSFVTHKVAEDVSQADLNWTKALYTDFGIKTHGLTVGRPGIRYSDSEIDGFVTKIESMGAAVKMVNGQNEVQKAGGTAWDDIAESHQKRLWPRIQTLNDKRETQGLDRILVGNPNFHDDGHDAAAENLIPKIRGFFDVINFHKYPLGRDPTTGLDQRGNKMLELANDPNMPVMCTEGGYWYAPNYVGGSNPVTLWAQDIYLKKMWLEYATRGWKISQFEFLCDVDPTGADREAAFGLLNTPSTTPSTWTARPSYTSLSKWTRITGGSNAKVPVKIELQGSNNTVKTLVVNTGTSSAKIFLWRDDDIEVDFVKTNLSPQYVKVTGKNANKTGITVGVDYDVVELDI